MEKTLSPDERIRRAEEIYYRKKSQATGKTFAKVNVSEENNVGLFKKMILQILICAVIYSIFYMIKNTNYVFSEEVINKTKEILNYNIDIKKIYETSKQYIFSSADVNTENTNTINDEIVNYNNSVVNAQEQNQTNDVNTSIELEQNIGGEDIEIVDENINLTQMEQDAKDILATKSFIIPLKGTITSRYGIRTPKTPTVPKNHTGIDIAANEGTVFIASMAGKVEKVSNIRRFRKSFYNSK